jgi:hypothetical protein
MSLIIIIIVIIIIGKTAPFLAIAFLKRFFQICLKLDHPVFTSLDVAAIMFCGARSSALRPTPSLED